MRQTGAGRGRPTVLCHRTARKVRREKKRETDCVPVGSSFHCYGGAIEVDMILYGFIYWKLNMLMLIILL